MGVNLNDPKQKFLVDRGWEYQGGGIWMHPMIVYEDGPHEGLKEWSLHEAWMWEEYNVWVKP